MTTLVYYNGYLLKPHFDAKDSHFGYKIWSFDLSTNAGWRDAGKWCSTLEGAKAMIDEKRHLLPWDRGTDSPFYSPPPELTCADLDEIEALLLLA